MGRLWLATWLLSSLAIAAPSPVADAAMRRDLRTVRDLISKKADVNAPQADGATALHWAVYNEDTVILDELIAAGAKLSVNRDGITPLLLGAMQGNPAIVRRLFESGASVHEKTPRGEPVLMMASRSGDLETLRLILDKKPDVNAKESTRGTTALMWAAAQGHADTVRLLIAGGADVKAMSDFDAKGSSAYLAPTPNQRAAQKRVEGKASQATFDFAAADAAAAEAAFGRRSDRDGGGLTSLVFAARESCLECVKALLDGGADINQLTHYGWTPLLTATQNRNYKLASYLLERGANPNISNNGGWSPLYLATDNRNIESGDYPVRNPDMDHLEFIKLLIAKGADVNVRVCGKASTPQECKGDSTETRTIFTMQWLFEDGATPFLRAAQSGDVELMKLLVEHGADPKIPTASGVTALGVAAGLGWVEGVTYEWSSEANEEAIAMCLKAGIPVNAQDDLGRAALHGAAHKGSNAAVQMLVDAGADLNMHDYGSRDSIDGAMKGMTWIPLHYSQGLVRVGVQSAIPHPQTEELLKKLMTAKGIPIPPPITSSICLTKGINGCQ